MSMYTLAKEIFPPTGIERVVRCNFVRPDILNVIVAKSSVLEIYNFSEPARPDQLPRLEMVASYRLNGIITSMGVIRTSSSGQHGLDSILVSFKDAKVCGCSIISHGFSPQVYPFKVHDDLNKKEHFHQSRKPDLLFHRLRNRCPCWNGHSRTTVLLQCRSITMSEMTTR